jgi:hypothetical protein
MPSSGMCRSVPLVRTDVSEDRVPSIIRKKRIIELGTTLAASLRGVTHCCSIAAIQRNMLVLECDY